MEEEAYTLQKGGKGGQQGLSVLQPRWGRGQTVLTEHSLCAGTGPKGRVPFSGQIPAHWPLACDLVSGQAFAIFINHKSTDEQTEALREEGIGRRLVTKTRLECGVLHPNA